MSTTYTSHIILSPDDPVAGHLNGRRPVITMGDLDIFVASALPTADQQAWLRRLATAASDLADALDSAAVRAS